MRAGAGLGARRVRGWQAALCRAPSSAPCATAPAYASAAPLGTWVGMVMNSSQGQSDSSASGPPWLASWRASTSIATASLQAGAAAQDGGPG